MNNTKFEYNPMAGLRLEADGSVTDERTGITLEVCENCGEYQFPDDDGYEPLCEACRGVVVGLRS